MTTIADYRDVVSFPAPAHTLEESGLSLDLVLQLTLKSLHFAGELSGTDLSRRLVETWAELHHKRTESRLGAAAGATAAARPSN
jgi:hypothetical protein